MPVWSGFSSGNSAFTGIGSNSFKDHEKRCTSLGSQIFICIEVLKNKLLNRLSELMKTEFIQQGRLNVISWTAFTGQECKIQTFFFQNTGDI